MYVEVVTSQSSVVFWDTVYIMKHVRQVIHLKQVTNIFKCDSASGFLLLRFMIYFHNNVL